MSASDKAMTDDHRLIPDLRDEAVYWKNTDPYRAELYKRAYKHIDQLIDRIEQLERELSISRMAQVVMDNSVAEVERLQAQNMRLSGMFYDRLRASPDPVPYAKRSPMEHERDEQ